MSLVPGVLHTVRRRVEARPLTLYEAKGNFDFFSPGAERILAILSDRRLFYVAIPINTGVWGQDNASSPL